MEEFLQKQQQKNKYIINMVNHLHYDPSLIFLKVYFFL